MMQMLFSTCCKVLVCGLLGLPLGAAENATEPAPSDGAKQEVSAPAAAEIAAQALFQRAGGLDGQAAALLRRLALALGASQISLAEARQILDLATASGLRFEAAAAPTASGGQTPPPARASAAADLGSLLDAAPSVPRQKPPVAPTGPAEAASVRQLEAPAEPGFGGQPTLNELAAKNGLPTLKPLTWSDTDIQGVVKMISPVADAEGTMVLLAHSSGGPFEVGQRFVIKKNQIPVARGTIAALKKTNAIGNIPKDGWLVPEPDKVAIMAGDPVTVQDR